MGFFKLFSRKKTTQGCVIVAGSAIGDLAQALSALLSERGLVLYQANHVANASLIQRVNLSDLSKHPSSPVQSVPIISNFELNLGDPAAVKQLFKSMRKARLHLKLLIVQPEGLVTTSQPDANERWQQSGLMIIQLAQLAIRHMLPRQQGSLIFLGTVPATITASDHLVKRDESNGNNDPNDDFPDESVLQDRLLAYEAIQAQLIENAIQAGIRALSQSLAREFQRKGIHISYLALKQTATQDASSAPALATLCWHVYRQSPDAWSQELRAV